VAQVVECLPSKREVQNSNPSTIKKKKGKDKSKKQNKGTKTKKKLLDWGYSSVVDHLPIMHKTLNSVPAPKKKKAEAFVIQ
jgi:hypothetical protein